MTEDEIRQIRHRRGWSQRDLAEHLNVTPKTVSFWETGRTRPDPEQTAALQSLGAGTTPRNVALALALDPASSLPVAGPDGGVRLVPVAELGGVGETLERLRRALRECQAYASAPRLAELAKREFEDALAAAAGRIEQVAGDRAVIEPYLVEFARVHERAILDATPKRPSIRVPVVAPRPVEDPRAQAQDLLDTLAIAVRRGAPVVVSYSWAYDRLLGERPRPWLNVRHPAQVVALARSVGPVDVPGLGHVHLDSFIVSATTRRPGDNHWPAYAGVYSPADWNRVLGRSRLLHRAADRLEVDSVNLSPGPTFHLLLMLSSTTPPDPLAELAALGKCSRERGEAWLVHTLQPAYGVDVESVRDLLTPDRSVVHLYGDSFFEHRLLGRGIYRDIRPWSDDAEEDLVAATPIYADAHRPASPAAILHLARVEPSTASLDSIGESGGRFHSPRIPQIQGVPVSSADLPPPPFSRRTALFFYFAEALESSGAKDAERQ